MSTMRTLMTGSLRLINAIQANEEPTANDMDITLSAFNALIDSMSNDILNIHTISPVRFLLVAGKKEYKLGPALDADGNPTNADWVIERPMRIEQAKVLLYPTVNGDVIGTTQSTLFMPLDLISDERYSQIVVRDLTSSWPTKMYDSGSYPTRTLRVWPVPQQQYAVELWLWQPLATYASLDDELNLPPGYERYLRFKLAEEISAEFGKPLSPSAKASLVEAEAAVKRMNQQLPVTEQSANGAQIGHRVNRVSQRGH